MEAAALVILLMALLNVADGKKTAAIIVNLDLRLSLC